MRFAYIDSQGKEVSIPGADALRLRIELGAIGDETMFYDSSTDKWAPAAEHEIYRTLKRELAGQEGGGFVAPPPPPMDSPASEAPTPEPGPASEAPAPDSGPASEATAEDASDPDGPASLDDLAPTPGQLLPDPFAALDGPASFADDETAGEADDPPEEPPSSAATAGGWDLGMELTLDEGMQEPSSGPSGAADEEASDAPGSDEGPGSDDDEAFDFGEFGALELEEPAAAEPELPSPSEVLTGSDDAEESGSDPAGMDFDDAAGGLELEPSLAEYSEESPPSWMMDDDDPLDDPDEPPAWTQEDDATGSDDESPDREAVRRKTEARKAVEARGGRTSPRGESSGSGPQRRPVKKRGAGVGVVAVVVLALVGAAGWFGMRTLSDGEEAPPPEPVVEIPDIPTRLEPRLRTLALRATQSMVAGLAELPERQAVPEAPNPDWLGGRYMANASEYEGIAAYWQSVADWVSAMRQAEADLFVEAYRAEVEAEGLTADDTELLLERGEAGFEAAARDRALVYDQLDQVAQAALSLHRFLEENEANIDYEPASGGLSRDPVLEAVPVNDDLGDEMWDRVGDITDALDALGLLDRVTTARLSEVFFEKLGSIPIR